MGDDTDAGADTAADATRVAVVGAGLTGLALTHHLRERGARVTCFEADGEPGGVVRSARLDGRVVERGPQRIRRTDPVAELIGAVGLESETVVADDGLPLFVYRDGRLRVAPRSVREFLGTDLLSWRGKLRALAEPLTGAADPEESAARMFRRKFGDEAYRNLIRPLFGGIYASDPAEMPVRHALSGLVRLERREGSLLWPALRRAREGTDAAPVSFEDGLQRLPEAIAAEHAGAVELGTPVERIERVDDGRATAEAGTGTAPDTADDARPRRDGGHPPRYRIVAGEGGGGADDAGGGGDADATGTDGATGTGDPDDVDDAGDADADGAGTSVLADHVVVTAAAPDAAAVLDGVAPDAADRLRGLTYNPIALVYLDSGYDRPGFGYQVVHDEDLRTRGVTFNAGLFGRDRLYTAFLGGMEDPGAVELADDELRDLAAREFEAVTGAPATALGVHRVTAYPAYDTSWAALDGLELPEGLHLATNYTARIGVPSRVREARRLAAELTGEGEEGGGGPGADGAGGSG